MIHMVFVQYLTSTSKYELNSNPPNCWVHQVFATQNPTWQTTGPTPVARRRQYRPPAQEPATPWRVLRESYWCWINGRWIINGEYGLVMVKVLKNHHDHANNFDSSTPNHKWTASTVYGPRLPLSWETGFNQQNVPCPWPDRALQVQ